MPPAYSLPDPVHVCEVGDAIVFLDVHRDRYFLLPAGKAVLFRRIANEDPGAALAPPSLQLAEQLVRARLVQPDELGRPLLPKRQLQAAPSVTAPVAAPDQIGGMHLLRMALAAAHAYLIWRTHSFESLANAVRRWKAQCPPESPSLVAKAAALAETFHRLAPYVFSADDACLLRSVLLLRYLSFHRVSANWVFGVRLSPFSAHCWVETGGLLLNDLEGNVEDYEPIMTV